MVFYVTSISGVNVVRFIVAKGTTLTQAREQLAGLLNYQLAEPIITKLFCMYVS